MSQLPKLSLRPNQSGYTYRDGMEILSTKLNGGFSKQRRQFVNASAAVQCMWHLNSKEYHQFKCFYFAVVDSGSKPFLIDLFSNDGRVLTEHEALFVPGSLVLNAPVGKKFTVSCELEVKPKALPEDAYMIGVMGVDWLLYEDMLHVLVNTDFPSDMELVS